MATAAWAATRRPLLLEFSRGVLEPGGKAILAGNRGAIPSRCSLAGLEDHMNILRARRYLSVRDQQ